MGSSRLRSNPFSRASPSPSPAPSPRENRPKSEIFTSPKCPSPSLGHARHQSFSPTTTVTSPPSTNRFRSDSIRNIHSSSSTFAPQFIKSEELQRTGAPVEGIEGENDFSGKRYVWLRNQEKAFVRGWIVEETEGRQLLVQCDEGSQRQVDPDSVDKVNPAKFDKADDMAELTHLNEPSVVHNLHVRYQADLIYTYSGLFLVTVNPYCPLPIYSTEHIRMYKGQSREDTKPHIFAMADAAFKNLVEDGENQSILVTGESGAGKTENTKKVIQYLAAVATSEFSSTRSSGRQRPNLSEQILRANPILEAFGNAQTVRNNNSSRFGKFIRIEFTRSGQIAGAFIDWYLLEKSRVVKLNSNERSYHIFYQLLRGASARMKEDFLIADTNVEDFLYTKNGNDTIAGVSDSHEWTALLESFRVMGFTDKEQKAVLQTVAAVLLLGNIAVMKESMRADQATLAPDAFSQAQKACHLLGIETDAFIQGLLHPKVKAGREWVEKVQTPEQVHSALDALSKGIYERAFGDLVSRLNRQLDRTGMGLDDSHFIGVLDIAGFEIFEENSFEQLCINYTNEKLQQFFNHHMFVLEQEEYAREQIEWKFIDFGKDLQPTIDLIELPNPIGIFSCLDEDSVMPKATDKTFTEKMHSLWDRKTPKYKPSRLSQGFILTHYAAEVEYSTTGWLEKNKDPLNDNITRLLASSKDKHTATLFSDCADPDEEAVFVRSRVKKGLFRTVAQRHKEQLSSLMAQLHSTHPHFVRCILPNHQKRPKQFNASLVLDQLRCNGVLEGIRIARTGFPNRLPFAEFGQRYEVLCRAMPRGYLEGQKAVQLMLEELGLDRAIYRVGLTKVFFRAGVLADLEEQRDALICDIFDKFQSVARGFIQRRVASKRLYRAEATRIIQHNLARYLKLCNNPWWTLFLRMKPLLGATQTAAEVKRRDERIQKLEARIQQENAERLRLDDERRRADAEAQRIQQTLESERSLALDKEEIFIRLQQRESELTEKLAGAIEDQENLEDQLDGLVEAKGKAESQANKWRVQVEQAGQIIEMLEADKHDLLEQVSDLNSRIFNVEQTKQASSSELDTLSRENKILQSQLHLQERKMTDLESSLNQSKRRADEYRGELDQANKWRVQKEQAGQTIERLENDKHDLAEQVSDLQNHIASIEETRKAKSTEQKSLKRDNEMLQSRLHLHERKVIDLESSLNLYKHRADDYFGKLEQAEIAVLKASRAEQHARSQAQEGEDTYATIMAERKQMDSLLEDLQQQKQSFEAKVEDLTADLDGALQAKKRLQHELEDYRSQRAIDVEDKETTLEQTRQKYQSEFATLTNELEIERENVLYARSETSRLRDELDELRSKWDDEVLNSSSWAKEKSRLEITLEELSSSREEALTAHNDAQNKIVSLLSQVRNLRSSMDDVAAERDMLQKEKRSLESRLNEAGDRFEDLARGESPSMRNAAGMDRHMLDLKSQLAQQQDNAAAAIGKMRRAESLNTEMQKDIVAERETNGALHKEKAALEKSMKDLQGRIVDLETKGYSSASQDVRFLNGRIQELEHQLEVQETQHATSLKSARNVDRTVKDLQSQLDRREKSAKQLTDDVSKGRNKIERLLSTIDELQAEEARSQLAARRAERDLREEREKSLRLERELEGWKGLRLDRGSNGNVSDWSGSMRGHGHMASDGGEGLNRMLSTTKNFL